MYGEIIRFSGINRLSTWKQFMEEHRTVDVHSYCKQFRMSVSRHITVPERCIKELSYPVRSRNISTFISSNS
uniref:Retrotrans_gag domain-containing protein n=1 Tax=Syphacia muris TaxID=451379 RepID=A0A0N5AVG5_9BILA